MKRLLVCVAMAMCGCESSEPLPVAEVGATTDPRFAEVLAYMKDALDRHEIPGGAIAIVEHGKLVAAAGVGEKEQGVDGGVTPGTLFRVASLTKMVTAATAMKLVEEGTLDLARSITDYVPLKLASGFDPTTVHVDQLLSHSAGIPDIDIAFSCGVGAGQDAAWFAANAGEPLWTPPGVVWNYSNRGFAIAGWGVAAASGQRFSDAATARVLGPAGMTTATFDPIFAATQDHAVGHEWGSSTFKRPLDAYDCEAMRPADGVIASVIDYAHLAETLLAGGGTMLSKASVDAMSTGVIDTHHALDGASMYGYGLEVATGYKGQTLVWHTGSTPGYQTAFFMVPGTGFAVVVFINANTGSPAVIARHAIDAYLGLQDIAAPVEKTTDYAPYVGAYLDPYVLGPVDVSLDDGALAMQVQSDAVSLVQKAGDEFEGSLFGHTGSVTFYPGADQREYLVTRGGVAVRH